MKNDLSSKNMYNLMFKDIKENSSIPWTDDNLKKEMNKLWGSIYGHIKYKLRGNHGGLPEMEVAMDAARNAFCDFEFYDKE